MKKPEKPVTASRASAQDTSHAAEARGKNVDRPGFDLGGSSGETQAGTGLGLGNDASDTAGERRLPGRRLENKATIPRWGGPELRGNDTSAKKPPSK